MHVRNFDFEVEYFKRVVYNRVVLPVVIVASLSILNS